MLQLYPGDRLVDTAVANYNFPSEIKANLWGYPLYAMKHLTQGGDGDGDAAQPAEAQTATGAMEVEEASTAGLGEAGSGGVTEREPGNPATAETAQDTERRLAREERRKKRRVTLSRSRDMLRIKNMDT